MSHFLGQTGKELTVPHQMSLAGAVSLPVFWLAGAGAAVFWVLGKPNHSTAVSLSQLFSLDLPLFYFSHLLSGATLLVIGSHAAFRELEGSDIEELLMEPV